MTYKACVRRDGAYHSTSYGGEIDMNQSLADPIFANIAVAWNKLFTVQVNHVITTLEKQILALVHTFSDLFKFDLKKCGIVDARIQRVEEQLQKDLLGQKLTDFINDSKNLVQERQKDANRIMTPFIKEQMKPGYQRAANESGTGSYHRMQQHLQQHLHQTKELAFSGATQLLEKELQTIITELVTKLVKFANVVVTEVQNVYVCFWEERMDKAVVDPAVKRNLDGIFDEIQRACTG